MELWDIYDGCFIKTGRIHERGKPLPKGDYHLVVHIYPVNKNSKILIQRRADNIRWKPGLWAATGGSALTGENAWNACRRELMEELGIEATRENSYMALTEIRSDHFTTVWVVNTDIQTKDLKLQKAEVADARWVSQEEIKCMTKEGLFIGYSYQDYLLRIINNR